MVKSIDFFRRQIAEANKDVTFDINSTKYYEDAKNIVDRILEDGVKARKSKRGLADPNYVKKTISDVKGEDFAKQIMKDADIPPKVL